MVPTQMVIPSIIRTPPCRRRILPIAPERRLMRCPTPPPLRAGRAMAASRL
jgi:hypothetical protein